MISYYFLKFQQWFGHEVNVEPTSNRLLDQKNDESGMNQKNMIVGIQSINAYYSDSTLSTPTQLWGSRSIFEMFLKMYTRSIVYWKNHVHSCKYEVFLFSLDYEPIVLRFFLFIIFKILKWNIFQCYYLKILTYVLTYVLCFH